MNSNNTLALTVAYYLSKFNRVAYENLGYNTKTEAHKSIGAMLGVKPTLIHNMRDEYDPIHDNARVGWDQRPLNPSRQKVLELYQKFDEPALREIVSVILAGSRALGSKNMSEQNLIGSTI